MKWKTIHPYITWFLAVYVTLDTGLHQLEWIEPLLDQKLEEQRVPQDCYYLPSPRRDD